MVIAKFLYFCRLCKPNFENSENKQEAFNHFGLCIVDICCHFAFSFGGQVFLSLLKTVGTQLLHQVPKFKVFLITTFRNFSISNRKAKPLGMAKGFTKEEQQAGKNLICIDLLLLIDIYLLVR